MARLRRKSIEIFSLSFLDCICCGFGAVLLLFVLTSGQQADTTRSELGSLQAQVAQAETALRVALAEAAKQTPTSEAPLRESLTVENAALEKAITAKQALLAAATQAQLTVATSGFTSNALNNDLVLVAVDLQHLAGGTFVGSSNHLYSVINFDQH